MSDRCSVTLTMRKRDLPKADRALGWPPDALARRIQDDDGQVVGLYEDETSYGWLDVRKTLAKAGIAFVGSHGSGAEYMGCKFAAHGGKMEEVNVAENGDLVVTVDVNRKGRIVPRRMEMKAIRQYLRLRRRAEKEFGYEK